jgi:hypothetical protein
LFKQATANATTNESYGIRKTRGLNDRQMCKNQYNRLTCNRVKQSVKRTIRGLEGSRRLRFSEFKTIST